MVRRIVFASILVLGVAPIIGAQPHRALQPAAFASAPGVVTASARRLARESPDPSEEATDVHDLLRRLRHKPPVPAEVKDDDPEYARPVWLRVPFISSSPANGVVVGAGLDVSFFRSPPAVTRASSFESSLAVSTRKQVLSSTRYSVYGRNDTWRLSGENRFDQTSIDLHPLGSGTLTADAVEVDYRSVRSFNTIYHRVYRDIYAGVGLRITSRSSIEPKPGGAAAWPSSDFMSYSRDMGLPNPPSSLDRVHGGRGLRQPRQLRLCHTRCAAERQLSGQRRRCDRRKLPLAGTLRGGERLSGDSPVAVANPCRSRLCRRRHQRHRPVLRPAGHRW